MQSNFPPCFWLVSHHPSFLCLWDSSLKPGTRPLSLKQVALISKDRVLIISFFLMQVGPYTRQLLILEAPQLLSRTYVCFTWLLSHDKFYFKIVWILKCSVLWYFENYIKFQLVEIFCNLEALRFTHLCTWFNYLKLLPVCIYWYYEISMVWWVQSKHGKSVKLVADYSEWCCRI